MESFLHPIASLAFDTKCSILRCGYVDADMLKSVYTIFKIVCDAKINNQHQHIQISDAYVEFFKIPKHSVIAIGSDSTFTVNKPLQYEFRWQTKLKLITLNIF